MAGEIDQNVTFFPELPYLQLAAARSNQRTRTMGRKKTLTLDEALDVVAYHDRNADLFDWLQMRFQGKVLDDTKRADAIRINQRHIEKLGARLNSLILTIDGIRVVKAFIKRMPPKSYLARHEMNAVKYWAYQYETFLHRVSTVRDLMQLVANEAFQVGLTPKDCNWENLKKSPTFSMSKMRGVMDSFYTELRAHIDLRNQVAHEGEIKRSRMGYLDAEISTIERMRGTARFNSLPEDIQRYYHPVHVKYRVREFKKELLDEIDATEQIVLHHLKLFLESLTETARFPK